MNRERIAFAAMRPLDLVVGAAVTALEATGKVNAVGDSIYGVARTLLGRIYARQNDLTAEGIENLPATGGAVIAANHQSWNDVQVLGATSPRRLRFLAKTELEAWPILRHLITLSDSPTIRRGGDRQGLAQAVEWLRDGKVLVIFPEGTIPGEEEVMRHEVEPETGLLRGHTGAVRLALAAEVPLVPVGISGTGASFPPEIYPRLELLEPPRPVPVTVRYGRPLTFAEHRGRDLSREELRDLTAQMMRAISALVDHERNYVPIRVPMEPLPIYEQIGVLLLHGFTSSLHTVDGLVPHLEAAGIPYRAPVLRGHGTHYTDLAGVTAQDWYDDAEAALLDLAAEVDRVVVVGFSMGGLVAINLGIRRPEAVAAVVTWAAALRYRSPLASMAPMLSGVIPSWPMPNPYNDPELAATSENYPRMMTETFGSLLNYAHETEHRLSQLEVPICVLHSKGDSVIDPVSANIIFRDVSSPYREIHWFTKSGHEMGQDLEREEVFTRTLNLINRFRPRLEPHQPVSAVTQLESTRGTQ